ncbi:MAG: MBL fold metallo-hydrolase [Gammaproteobacteria bacterium]|nr:MBL fold metallo-hydrolase [Gammaproteobacteria bacterium]MDH3560469.1 MBL fold metallo-hydrolase [Gammaproteobacteria bacterium]
MTSGDPFSIHALELGPMENFIYLIHDHATDRAAVVDPAWEVPEVLALARQQGVTITDILLTHSHHDHINGIEAVLEKFDAQLHLLKEEARFWGSYLDLPTLHHGGDRIELGETAIQVLHTPGHTPGSACYHIGDNLITGDTLFVFGCGRCDLRGGDPEQMYTTLKGMAQRLPSGTRIHPGHNYAEKSSSTLEEQIAGNPFMHFDTREQFIHYRMHYHDKHRDSPYGPVCKGEEMK